MLSLSCELRQPFWRRLMRGSIVAEFPRKAGQGRAGQGFYAQDAVPPRRLTLSNRYVSNDLSTTSTIGWTMYNPQTLQLRHCRSTNNATKSCTGCRTPCLPLTCLHATDRTLQPRASRACHGRTACNQKHLVAWLLLEAPLAKF